MLLKFLFWIVLAVAIYLHKLGHLFISLGIGAIAACVFVADIWVAYRRPPAEPSAIGELLSKPEWTAHKLALYLMLTVGLTLSARMLYMLIRANM